MPGGDAGPGADRAQSHLRRVDADAPIRSIHVAGTLRFDPTRDTRLDVGLIKIQAGDDAERVGLRLRVPCRGPVRERDRSALEVGTADRPIARDIPP